MKFKCNKLVFSNPDVWDELVDISFINGNNYISISALAYEDQINIEINDQVNVLYLLKEDFDFIIENNFLHLVLEKVIFRNNIDATTINIELSPELDLKLLNSALAECKIIKDY
jgi:hypothetical protein